ncbi:Polyadenylate-binding protein 2 [Apostasia shenzhenica]|uniref:Polyadenylate-binding protein 2 n=1 Tax=Apostasia shenzhenica TaxID=1088818 RepID=A0A2I0BDM1_9ASPA|nr:Polyadenylate-binding protein 2 [Apostasia shenzhenica]
MPPRKKKTLKAVRRTKTVASSVPASSTAVADESPTSPSELCIADVSNFSALENNPVTAPASDLELEPSTEPDNAATFSANTSFMDLVQVSHEASPPKKLFATEIESSTEPDNVATASSNAAYMDFEPVSEEPLAAENHGAQPPERIATTSDEPSARSEPKAAIRVRKVVRKKIIKRLVPKGSVVSKPREDDAAPVSEISEKNLSRTPVKDGSIQQVSSTAMAETSGTNPNPKDDPQSAPRNAEKLALDKADHGDPSAKNELRSTVRVRKKIIKRLVPKGSVAKKADAMPREEDAVLLSEISEKNLRPTAVKDDGIQQVSSTAFAETSEANPSRSDNLQSATENTEVDKAGKLALGKAKHDEPSAKNESKNTIRVRKKTFKRLVPKGSTAAKKADTKSQGKDTVPLPDVSKKNLNPAPAIQQVSLTSFAEASETNLNPSDNLQMAPANIKMDEVEHNEPSAKRERKTTIRVRKKVFKRLVPKGCVAAKKVDAMSQEEDAVPLPEISENLNPIPVIQRVSSSTLVETSKVNTNPKDNQQSAPENTEKDKAGKLASGKAEHRLKGKEERHMFMSEDVNAGRETGDEEDDGKVNDEEMAGLSERAKRRKTEIFVGGLNKDAKEEDLRAVFDKVGKILEVRMMMDAQTGKSKGYAFLRYAEPKQAKRALTEFSKVEICGKLCRAAAIQGNDTIFLGNIDKKWKKEDVIKLLTEVGIENIDTVTVVMDPDNLDSNRGFAFLELETNRDAQRAYKVLQKKDVLGKCRNIKVAWAESSNAPDEEEMQKVKSVYVEGIRDSWDEDQLREFFKKFGDIDRIVLGRNIKTTKRNDFAFINYKTREAALLCIKCFSGDEITDSSVKLELKVSLAKRVQKAKQNQGGKQHSSRNSLNVMPKPIQGLPTHDSSISPGMKRNFSTLGSDMLYSNLRCYPQARLDGAFAVSGSSYNMMPRAVTGSSLPYYQHQPSSTGYYTGPPYGPGQHPNSYQMRQGAPPPPYTSSFYQR